MKPFFLFAVGLAICLSGCGGGSQLPPAAILVSVSPTSATLRATQQKQFTATVTNDGSQRGVNWSIAGCTGGASVCGSVSPATTASGTPAIYTAPASVPGSGTLQVTATSASDSSKSGSATVTITAASAVTVSVSPSAATIQVGNTQTFSAAVNNDNSSSGVNWSIVGCTGGASVCGSVSPASTASGASTVYTAPASVPGSGSLMLTATSVADPSKSSSAMITITTTANGISVSISPAVATVQVGESQNISAVVNNDTSGAGVAWAVTGCTGSSHACGYLASLTGTSVLYVAPDSPAAAQPSAMVTATSITDGTQSASAIMTITPAPISFSVRSFPAGNAPTSVAIQDFDSDGKVDVAVADNGDTSTGDLGDVSILQGNGDGTLNSATGFSAGSNPIFVATGDFNRDGTVDLFASDLGARLSGGNGALSVLLGKGNGVFNAPSTLTAGENPFSLASGDFNNDGNLDIAVSDFGGRFAGDNGGVHVLLGNGDGTFKAAVLVAAGENPVSIVAADFNSDGKLDLAVADQHVPSSTSHGGATILLGNGDGTFQVAFSSPIAAFPTSISTGDFNGDHKTDLVIASFISAFGLSGSDLNIWIGDGAGNFTPHAFLTDRTSSGSVFPLSVVVGDFDGDAKDDLAEVRGKSISVLRGNGDGTFHGQLVFDDSSNGTFQGKLIFSAGSGPFALAVGDFNRDGKPDLAVANNGSDDVSILLNTSP